MAKAFLRSVRARKRKAALADLASVARKEIEAAMDKKVKPALVKSHEKVVKDWKSDVGFAAKKVIKPDSIAVYVYPTGDDKKVWFYVDQGVKPHAMPAVTGKLMVFRAGGTYVPKTMAKPARTVVGGGFVQGGEKVVTTKRKAFTHPGNEPRNFTAQIAADIEPEFKQEIENAFRRTAARTYE